MVSAFLSQYIDIVFQTTYNLIYIGERGKKMHELGVLCQIVKKVNRVAEEHKISHIKHITLEVGEASSFIPVFLEKLFPAAVESFPAFHSCTLKIEKTEGKGLVIKDIGY